MSTAAGSDRPPTGRDGHFAAVDLGAASGRVMLGAVGPGRLELTELHRFPNGPVDVAGTLYWDILGLYGGVLEGLREAGRAAPALDSVGVDGWGVDYGLLDETGALVANPVAYRDTRTDGVLDTVLERVPAAELYDLTGTQQLPLNTACQLVAARDTPALRAAHTLLLLPDLITYWLTGEVGAERTNASTTQLVDVRTGEWSRPLIRRLGIPEHLFPPIREPGSPAGVLRSSVLTGTGLSGPVPVTLVGSHDTASAVLGVPARDPHFGYVCCGTWSLVGVELDRPVLTEEGRAANFSNETGVDGRVRYLRNVMGLWLLQECLRTWSVTGPHAVDVESVVRAAAGLPGLTCVVDPDDPAFLRPGDMPARIAAVCEWSGQSAPDGPAGTVRCILDSLALAHRRAIRQAQELSGHRVDVLHVVGGGARNALLCQLTADACSLPVVAGPVEATALGNILVQARARGVVRGELEDLRMLLQATQPLVRYEPDRTARARRRWQAAEARVHGSAADPYHGASSR